MYPPLWDHSSSASAISLSQRMRGWFWRDRTPQVLFICLWWPCRCPNVIITIAVCWAEQTQKPLYNPQPPAAPSDSPLWEYANAQSKWRAFTSRFTFQGDVPMVIFIWKPWIFILILLFRRAVLYWLCQGTVYVNEKIVAVAKFIFVQSGQKNVLKSTFTFLPHICTFTVQLLSSGHHVSFITVLSVNWMHRKSCFNINSVNPMLYWLSVQDASG